MVKTSRASQTTRVGVTYAQVVRIARELPGVEEGTSYGTPGLKVRGKFLSRLREDDVLVLKVGSILERDHLLTADPAVFHITDHYREYPAVLIRLSRIREAELRQLLTDAWRRAAPRKLVAAFDAKPPHDGNAR